MAAGLTDGLFMSSRDGRTFHRWREAFLRPGLRPKDNWVYGDNYQNWGLVETKSPIDGAPVDGFAPDNCPEVFGDDLQHKLAWQADSNLSKLIGRPVRLRFVMRDADLYALRFGK